jgi:hypothetical protein
VTRYPTSAPIPTSPIPAPAATAASRPQPLQHSQRPSQRLPANRVVHRQLQRPGPRQIQQGLDQDQARGQGKTPPVGAEEAAERLARGRGCHAYPSLPSRARARNAAATIAEAPGGAGASPGAGGAAAGARLGPSARRAGAFGSGPWVRARRWSLPCLPPDQPEPSSWPDPAPPEPDPWSSRGPDSPEPDPPDPWSSPGPSSPPDPPDPWLPPGPGSTDAWRLGPLAGVARAGAAPAVSARRLARTRVARRGRTGSGPFRVVLGSSSPSP